MSDEINSPGQLRQFEENQGWLPRQSETPAMGAGDGYNGATLPAPEDVKPMTMGRYAQKVSFNKGDYFSHDNKVFYKNPEGKVSLVTGDAMGDVELNDEQTKQLEKERADKSAREKAEKDGPVYTDQVPEGKVEPNEPGNDAMTTPNNRPIWPSIELTKPTPEETDWIAKNIGGPVVAASKIAQGLPDAGFNPVKHIGNIAVNGLLGYSSGYGATKLFLPSLPVVPRIKK